MPIQDPSFTGTRKASYEPAVNAFENTTPMAVGFRQANGTTVHPFDTASPELVRPSRKKSWCTRPKIFAAAAVTILLLLLIIILPSVLIRKPDSGTSSNLITDKSAFDVDGVLQARILHPRDVSVQSALDQLYANNRSTHFEKRSLRSDFFSANFSGNSSLVIDNADSVHFYSSEEQQFSFDLGVLLMKAVSHSELCSLFSCQHLSVEDLEIVNNSVSMNFVLGLKAHLPSLHLPLSTARNISSSFQEEFASGFNRTFYPNLVLDHTEISLLYGPLCKVESVRCDWSPNEFDPISSSRVFSPLNSSDLFGNFSLLNSSQLLNNDTFQSNLTDIEPFPTEPAKPNFRLPLANCSGHGFQCANLKQKIATRQRCDGVKDCSDGSDEEFCRECVSSLKCPINAHTVFCLRGHQLCDGKRDCPTGQDESPLFCKSKCSPGLEYKCRNADVCIPNSFLCDGDAHCPGGDDEVFCNTKTGCNNNAFLCKKEGKCVAAWSRCNGVWDCSDGSDEQDCGCLECSGAKVALCHNRGTCLSRNQVCNGVVDCTDAEDEQNCPGWCSLEEPVETVRCKDNKFYPKRYACGGKIQNCESSCDICDFELAYQCAQTKACISRSKLCDGVPHCSDGSDESAALCSCNKVNSFRCSGTNARCIPPHKVCDGFQDCLNGEDETNCTDCHNNPSAFYCHPTKTCLASLQRCDGTVDCPDYSDEDNCTCTACKSHHGFQTYLCRDQHRCLHQSYICNPLSNYHCPGVLPEDLEFCPNKFDPLSN